MAVCPLIAASRRAPSSRVCTYAPAASNSLTVSGYPNFAATCSGQPFCALTSAPASTSIRTASVWPHDDAMTSGPSRRSLGEGGRRESPDNAEDRQLAVPAVVALVAVAEPLA